MRRNSGHGTTDRLCSGERACVLLDVIHIQYPRLSALRRKDDSILAIIESGECVTTSREPWRLTDTSGVDRRKGVLLFGSQTHVLHPKGVEHIPQHRLFFRCEIACGLL